MGCRDKSRGEDALKTAKESSKSEKISLILVILLRFNYSIIARLERPKISRKFC